VWRIIRRTIGLAYLRASEWVLGRVGRRRPYGILTLELSGELAEEGGEQRFLGLLRRPTGDYLSAITLLRWARDDERLSGVLIRCDDLDANWARLQGLRRSLDRLRAAGKKVWMHLERAGVHEYYLASAADQVSLTPAATLDVTGLSSEAVFLVDALEKLGIRADDTAAYVFQDCRIPRDHLLGGDEDIPKESSGGFRGVMKTFNMTRPMVAAIGLGMGEAALDFTRDALAEAGIAITYGRALGTQPAAAERFIRLEAIFEAAKLVTLRASWLADQGESNNMEASIAKAKAGGAVRDITQGCIEILGPMGVSREHLLEKWFRDVRITDIYEGTGEIQRLIIARTLLGYSRHELK